MRRRPSPSEPPHSIVRPPALRDQMVRESSLVKQAKANAVPYIPLTD
jgi:hypothetical protein